MEPEDKKISVWICQEEKLISGLSRRTTCSDVVRVLLEDSKQRRRRRQQGHEPALPPGPECGVGELLLLSGPAQSYCIVEKWRGFERILPNKTKLLRLWGAWGPEQENVRFVLVRSEASLPNTGPRSAEARVVLSKGSPGRGGGGTAGGVALSQQERQRRVVRKAFRKLAKLNHHQQHHHKQRRGAQPTLGRDEDAAEAEAEPPAKERMETLVHLVLSQDHTLRQQVKRIRELDREIDRYEAKVHFDRMKRHGVNYVQDTYLVGGEEADEAEPDGDGGGGGDLAAYARKCEQVARLQAQWRRQEALLEHVAAEIQQELNERWMKRRRDELAAARASSSEPPPPDCDTTEVAGSGELHAERERVQTQLSTSLYIGLRLNTDLEAVKGELAHAQCACAAKEGELQQLLDTLQALDVQQQQQQQQDQEVEVEAAAADSEARGSSKDNVDDEDSDTGLSSMHSQDSDSTVPVCESLV